MKSNYGLHKFSPTGPDAAGVLSWVHIGDLHMTKAGEQNHRDLAEIVDNINAFFAGSVSFCYLPGDVADNGSREAYAVVRHELDRLKVPWCSILGDHDVHERSHQNFLEAMAECTHYAFNVDDTRFIALNAFDVPEPGSFTVSQQQMDWLKAELHSATDAGQIKVLLLHCYPSELKAHSDELAQMVRDFGVRLIDMGHTHYNEIANDGHTLYTATRSTGQIEEGPVGFSITNIDDGAVSWRFVELGKLPVVMITQPEEERLLTGVTHSGEADSQQLCIRAKIWAANKIVRVLARIEEHEVEMHRISDSLVWEVVIEDTGLHDGIYLLRVCAEDAAGGSAEDEINILIGDGVSSQHYPERDQDNTIGPWPAHGILGTQLGPNKNGKKW